MELWDLRLGDRILWDAMGEPQFAETFLPVLHELHAGGGQTLSRGPLPPELRAFEAVFVGGGSEHVAALRRSLAGAAWPVAFSGDGSFVGAPGGLALLAAEKRDGLVVDLGQGQLKVATRFRRWRFPRDLRRLPTGDQVAEADVDMQRAELRRFVSESLRLCLADCGASIEGVVFALPSRLDDAGVPEGSSYAGMAGDTAFVADVLELAGLDPCSAWILNDAELAALSARLHPEVSPERRTLVLTIGFGLGAAMLMPWA